MSAVVTWVEMGEAFLELARDQSAWSQATFGTDAERGPVGALKHLEKESREAQEAAGRLRHHAGMLDTAAANAAELDLREELADCLLLILDASRRAGLKPRDLIRAAQAKMAVNKTRAWPKPEADTPVEHVRDLGGES